MTRPFIFPNSLLTLYSFIFFTTSCVNPNEAGTLQRITVPINILYRPKVSSGINLVKKADRVKVNIAFTNFNITVP